MKLLAVATTVATLEAARALARSLVERRLAACAEITAIESFYAWKGELANDPEFRIVFKTTDERYPAVEAAIRESHGYELPAIDAVVIERASEPYARWVEESCR
jgi:periplasmic divalent cation tolerance protein